MHFWESVLAVNGSACGLGSIDNSQIYRIRDYVLKLIIGKLSRALIYVDCADASVFKHSSI